MPPKRKGVEHAAAAEEPQTKRHHAEGVTLPEEIVVEIISHLPLQQIFSLHTLSKSINNALKDSTQTLWKRLVKQYWRKPHNNDHWNDAVEYGEDNEKWKDEKAPYSNAMGSFCLGEKPTVEAQLQWIEEASNEKCKLVVQTWVIIEIWTKALPPPLYYPDRTANMEPEMYPFYLCPDDSLPLFKRLAKTINAESGAELSEGPMKDFHQATIVRIIELLKEEAEDAEDEEDGGKNKDKEPECNNFPRGSKAKWEQLPKLLWENAKWGAMENPFISWHGGEVGPWEYMHKMFWGQRKDNSIVGFIAIVDNS